jgi:hypothetical protein
MNRERAVRAALLSYPDQVRERDGAEMTATVLDVAVDSRRRFVRELADLVRLGLRARAKRTAAAGAARVIADGVCLAAVWLLTLDLATLLAQTVRGFHDPLLAPPSLALLGAALVLALVGHDRLAGIAALTWTAARFPALLDHHPDATLAVTLATLPSAACFAVLIMAPRRRPRDLRRLAWLIVPATLVIALGPPSYDQSPLLLGLIAIAALLVVLYALATLTTDPRVAIAGAVVLTTLGAGAGPALVPAAPLVLAVVALRVRQLRRHVPI